MGPRRAGALRGAERRIKSLVSLTFPLEQAAEATRYHIEDRPMGKVVLTM